MRREEAKIKWRVELAKVWGRVIPPLGWTKGGKVTDYRESVEKVVFPLWVGQKRDGIALIGHLPSNWYLAWGDGLVARTGAPDCLTGIVKNN